ncbi:MAG: methionyl-tRNA formyltransferase, partial [Candidatus Latescibacteria bacterium]|nr:methionyl-tRNA formyltransferase [Candidatus Latescibacterota bacterium]
DGSIHKVVSVVTRPDRPGGRGRRVAPSPTKTTALELGIPVAEYEDLKGPRTGRLLKSLNADMWVVVAFPIIPEALLDIPALGIVNLHASLLPRYRGAAPVQWAIIRGETVTGVTTFFIDAGVDTGSVCLQREVGIGPEETAGELADRLAEAGAELIVETVVLVESGEVPRIVQDQAMVTPAPKLNKADGEIDWFSGAIEVVNRVRGLNPWPGSYTFFKDERILVLRARCVSEEEIVHGRVDTTAPGTIVGFLEDGSPVVVAGDGAGIALLDLQRAGRQRAKGADVARGQRWQGGEKLH